MSLRADVGEQPRRWYDRLPDSITTTAQCLRYLVDRTFELPAIPPRRRRRFDLHRLKFDLRVDHPELCDTIGGITSLFGLLRDQSRYTVIKRFDQLDAWADRLPDPKLRLDMIEFHAYDLASHWNLDRPAVMREYLRQLDGFLGRVRQRCADQKVTFMLLVDHGQEVVTRHINLRAELRRLDVPEDEYDYFLAVAVGRFWFHTDRAREAITAMLRRLPHVNVRTSDELREYGCGLDAARFGELYAITDQGALFFPHDFFNRLGNTFLGLKNPLMRSRVLSGRHRGYHGHLPDHPAELGYMSVADDRWDLGDAMMDVIDFAPTVLAMLGQRVPEHMHGRCLLNNPASAVRQVA